MQRMIFLNGWICFKYFRSSYLIVCVCAGALVVVTAEADVVMYSIFHLSYLQLILKNTLVFISCKKYTAFTKSNDESKLSWST